MYMTRILGGLVLGAALAGSVVAAEPEAHNFAAGTKAFTLATEYVRERRDSDIYLANVSAGYGYYFWDNIAFEIHGVGYYAYDDAPAIGGGASILARWHFLNIGRFSLYGDVLGGIMQLDGNFPNGGTHFNFTYQGGPGMAIQLRDSLFLIGGARFEHVSNGFIDGRDRNPIFNSYGGYIGLMWTF